MFTSPFRPLTFGEILDGAFTLYRRHFLTFFITALLPYVPVGIVGGWFTQSAGAMGTAEEPSLEYVGLAFVVMIVTFVAFVVIFGALTRQSSQAYTGGEVSLGDGFRQGMRSFFWILVSSFVGYLMISSLMFLVVMVFVVLMAVAFAAAGESSAVAIGVGVVMVLAVLAVMLAISALFFAIVPAIVVERRGPFDAIGRSFALAWGALPRVIGVLAVSFVIVLLPVLGAMLLVGLTEGFASVLSGAGALSPAAAATQQLITTLGYALTLPFLAAALVLLYYDRRARTEAHDLEGMVQGLALAR